MPQLYSVLEFTVNINFNILYTLTGSLLVVMKLRYQSAF